MVDMGTVRTGDYVGIKCSASLFSSFLCGFGVALGLSQCDCHVHDKQLNRALVRGMDRVFSGPIFSVDYAIIDQIEAPSSFCFCFQAWGIRAETPFQPELPHRYTHHFTNPS